MFKKIKTWLYRIFSARAGIETPRSNVERFLGSEELREQMKGIEKIMDRDNFQCCGKGCSSHNENMKRHSGTRGRGYRRNTVHRHRSHDGGVSSAVVWAAASDSSSSSSGGSGGCGGGGGD